MNLKKYALIFTKSTFAPERKFDNSWSRNGEKVEPFWHFYFPFFEDL